MDGKMLACAASVYQPEMENTSFQDTGWGEDSSKSDMLGQFSSDDWCEDVHILMEVRQVGC